MRSLILLAVLLIQACGSSSNPTATWTIFVYGHGDHNLSGSLATDIEKMTNATLANNVNIIVAADWNADAEESDGDKYPTGLFWYKVTGGGRKTLLMKDQEANLDEPENLKNAITYAFESYPAQRYGIIMWDHGGAWNYGFGGDTQDGTIDNSDTRGISIIEMHNAISNGLSEAGITGTLDFLGFDTCLLGTAEVAYLMKDLTKVYIANAELDFGSGWNYKEVFTELAANTDMTPIEFAEMELQKWEALHQNASYDDELLRSHTAIETAKVDDLAAAVKELVDAIEATKEEGVLPNNGEIYATGSALAIPSYGMTAAQRTSAAQYLDLGQFLKYLVDNATGNVKDKAQIALDAIATTQIGRDYGSLRDPNTSYELGLQIGLPDINTINNELLENYRAKASDWSDATGWDALLSDLMSSRSSEAPTATFIVDPDTKTAVFTPSGAALTFGTVELLRTDPDTPSKQLYYGTLYDGTIATDEYSVEWDGNIWKVGELEQESSVIPWFQTSDIINTVTHNTDNLLGAYGTITENDGTQSMGVLIFKADQTSAWSIAYKFKENEWSVSTITEFIGDHPGATFLPARIRVDEETLVPEAGAIAERLPTTGGVPIKAASAPSGTYFLSATAENAWGYATTSTDTDHPITQ